MCASSRVTPKSMKKVEYNTSNEVMTESEWTVSHWTCSTCTYLNKNRTVECGMCGKASEEQSLLEGGKEGKKLVGGKRGLAQQSIASLFANAKRQETNPKP